MFNKTGYKNHVNHSKNQHILNIVKQRTFGSWRRGVQGAEQHSKTKFLKFFLDVGQSDGAINPKMEMFPCNASELPSIW